MTKAKNTTTKAPEATATITVKALCEELNAEPKAFRRWLRNQTSDRAGKGGRWLFTEATAATTKERYANRAAAKGTNPELDDDSDEG